MPVKWKIFLGLNFVIGLPAFVFLVLLLIHMAESNNRSEDYLWSFIAIAALVIIIANCFLNIFLLQRFYPDKLIPGRIKKINLLSLVLTTLIATGMLILGVYGASEEFSAENEYSDSSGKIVLVILFLALLLQTIILIMQGRLPILVSRNHEEKMHSMIDSIGQ